MIAHRDYFYRMASAYLDAAEWADWPSDEEGNEEGDSWAREACASADAAVRECLNMIISDDDDRDIESVLVSADIGPESAGHDLWLTRNRHGTGFWDRGYDDDVAKILTDAAHSMGGSDPYIGDDGLCYLA